MTLSARLRLQHVDRGPWQKASRGPSVTAESICIICRRSRDNSGGRIFAMFTYPRRHCELVLSMFRAVNCQLFQFSSVQFCRGDVNRPLVCCTTPFSQSADSIPFPRHQA